MQEFKLESYDKTPIYVRIWDDVENPKAVLQISHGMCEHGGRYELFAQYMNKQGYIVFADDHRAHGRTESKEDVGRHKGDIFTKTLNDLVFFHNWLKQKYALPQVFLGHSYGSFLGQAFLQQNTDVLGVALCGSANMNGTQLALPLIFPIWLLAKNWRPSFINKGSDLLFNGRYKNDKGPSQWLTRDLERRQAFLDDEFCGIYTSINFNWHMIRAFGRLYTKKAVAALNKSTPIALFSGDMDPIGGTKASKVIRLNNFYHKAGVERLEMHLYVDCRHELLNEINREQIFADICSYFDSCL